VVEGKGKGKSISDKVLFIIWSPKVVSALASLALIPWISATKLGDMDADYRVFVLRLSAFLAPPSLFSDVQWNLSTHSAKLYH
jgi:hypothetical protein